MGPRRKLFPDIVVDTVQVPPSPNKSSNKMLNSPSNNDKKDYNDNDNDHNNKSRQQHRFKLLKLIQYIESIKVPTCCLNNLPQSIRSKIRSNNNNNLTIRTLLKTMTNLYMLYQD